MQIPIDRSSDVPLYAQIARFIHQQIRIGNLPPGSSLPPIRSLAGRLGVSKAVVSLAYDELATAGMVEGRVGAGTVVTASGEQAARRWQEIDPGPPTDQAGALYDLLRLANRPGLIRFNLDAPASGLLPTEAFNRSLRAALQEHGPEAYAYGPPEGAPQLREMIARYLATRGISTSPDQILITAGAQNGIDLVVRSLVSPGDTVLVESPCHLGALQVFAACRVHVQAIPVDGDGLDPERVADFCARFKPRLLYTNPTYQNPTGSTMPLERRRRLVRLADEHGLTILEDGVCNELEFHSPAPPALCALGGPVIHVGSFTKSLLPGLRLGYLVASPEQVQRFTRVRQATDVNSPMVLQLALAHFMAAGHLERHLPLLRQELSSRQRRLQTALAAAFPAGTNWTAPAGGMHLWVRLPEQANVVDLYRRALASDVAFAPGDLFFPGPAPAPYMRLSYGNVSPGEISEGIARLSAVLQDACR
ncbi:MAG: DNA-binding domain- and aminotransferase transcriptional regulator [Symbiobacteriaceae bacterium]|nr:DNA-binding domain- and aminotransferase transcriptional regulator [Symbiobacteriaceae bacterium]